MEKCQSVAFSCLSGSLNCSDRHLCFQEVGNRHLFLGAAIWQAFFSGNKIKTNMSECSSSSTDADQPGEKLDLSVSGLMVLLYASVNERMCACGWWGFSVRWGCSHANAHLCTWKYFWNHLSDLKGDATYRFEQLVALVLEALNNTGEKSFKVSQSDISWLSLPKKQEETLSSHHQALCLARPEIQKTCHFWKSGDCDVSLKKGLFLLTSIPLRVSPQLTDS